jgi:signal transduction histidine kinase
MNNAVQHSKTESIRLHIMKNEDNLELLFEDYGKGFDLNEVHERKTNRKGVGLSSMKERAQMSGGSLKVKSSPGIGTTIHASWTIKAGGVDQGQSPAQLIQDRAERRKNRGRYS